MKISIVSGKAEGPTRLNAFDNALSEAGIGDVNLIKVSSMLEKNTNVIPLPKLKAGAMVNCVLSSITSHKPNDKILACIGVAIGENLGCVVETTGINQKSEDIKEEALFMVKYMMEKRNEAIKELIIEEVEHEVKEIGSVVASVVYVNDDIIE